MEVRNRVQMLIQGHRLSKEETRVIRLQRGKEANGSPPWREGAAINIRLSAAVPRSFPTLLKPHFNLTSTAFS